MLQPSSITQRVKSVVPDGRAARLAFSGKLAIEALRGRVGDLVDPAPADLVGAHPLPSPWLRAKVIGTGDARTFLAQGRSHHSLIVESLVSNGLDPDDPGSVLDFGCGCGRIMRWWPPEMDLHGCDIDRRLLSWCRAHLPEVAVRENAIAPPTSFASESFDLIYAISIFTHLTPAAEQAWLEEYRRLLRPGGHLLFTVHGEGDAELILGGSDAERFRRGERVGLFPRALGSNICAAYHPRAYVQDSMTAGFDSLEVRHGSADLTQDIHLFRKS